MSPEARTMLTRAGSVPPPSIDTSRRKTPLVDRYPLTGRTYTTASGARIPNELQYYDGEMVHVYGECTNVAAVHAALDGSGYRPMVLVDDTGRRTAVAQLWFSRFDETSIGPYSAMFIVVAAVREDAPAQQASIRADPNGASSALPMLVGDVDPVSGVYENRARLFLVRLLDTTQVAIDVGRERMGTDKRRGSMTLAREGRRIRIAVRDGSYRGVVDASLECPSDDSYAPALAKAAATAGVTLQALPGGTEYAYPAVARIGRAPVVSWVWRTDSQARLQRVGPGSVTIHAASEEGRMLQAWNFTPHVMAHIPDVRGVVTGLADPDRGASPADHASRATAAAPARAIDLRAETVPLRPVVPGSSGVAGRLPVLRLVAREEPVRRSAVPPPIVEPRSPRWAWETTFLGSLTALLRREKVGITADGLRINWHVTTGSFVGPGLDAVVLPGAADWMRIRTDGVAIVNVQACFETRDGALVYGSYGGIFDLGPDGYARAVRDEYPELPPVVVTPTYATADPRLAWLNRAQCVGVGRVDMSAFRVEFDVYVVRVGGRTGQERISGAPVTGCKESPSSTSLYERIGGQPVIEALTDDFVAGVLGDRQLARFFPGPVHPSLRGRVVDLLCAITGGPCAYTGRDMKSAHRGLGISETDWTIAVNLFTAALGRRNVAPHDAAEFLRIIENMKGDIVEPAAV